MLTRVYGTAFFLQEDPRSAPFEPRGRQTIIAKSGRELGIYMMDESAGVGLPPPSRARLMVFCGGGGAMWMEERVYKEGLPPFISTKPTWKTSGHYGFYKENMYFFNINEGTEEEPLACRSTV